MLRTWHPYRTPPFFTSDSSTLVPQTESHWWLERIRWCPGHILQLNFSWKKSSCHTLSDANWSVVSVNNGKVHVKRAFLISSEATVCTNSAWACGQAAFSGVALVNWMHLNEFDLPEHPSRVWHLMKKWRKALYGSVMSCNNEVD